MTNFQVKTMLLTMMMNPPTLFKNNFLKEKKEFKENMGKPLMINNNCFLQQQRSLGLGHSSLFFTT